jgi:DNA polymerase-4
VGIPEILAAASDLLATVYPFKRPVRLLGITLSTLMGSEIGDAQPQSQLDLGL